MTWKLRLIVVCYPYNFTHAYLSLGEQVLHTQPTILCLSSLTDDNNSNNAHIQVNNTATRNFFFFMKSNIYYPFPLGCRLRLNWQYCNKEETCLEVSWNAFLGFYSWNIVKSISKKKYYNNAVNNFFEKSDIWLAFCSMQAYYFLWFWTWYIYFVNVTFIDDMREKIKMMDVSIDTLSRSCHTPTKDV